MRGKAVMIQGTASYVGKTTIVAALCRILSKAGLKVAPFKAQNMSLNSYVTPDGKEISRAQALQAFAAGVEPRVEMNPILLKPKGRMVSQVVLMGEPYRDISAGDYYSEFALNSGIHVVEKSLNSLLSEFEVVIIEGAGSPAEINLYQHEITNMRVARLADAPVFLVADIERGGVFASIVGTISLLEPNDRERVKGVIINKFRGDPSVLEPGLKKLEELTGKPVLGVVPYVENLDLPWEDSVSLDDLKGGESSGFNVAVIRLPFISNFTDILPLIAAGMHVYQVRSSNRLRNPDIVIIPGTKNTIHDLKWLKRERFDKEILRLRRNGVPIIGICGGYQILGKKLVDPHGIEGGIAGKELEGLGLLDVETRFSSYTKRTSRVTAEVLVGGPLLGQSVGKRIRAYEIHMGETRPGSDKCPFRIFPDNGPGAKAHYDGAISSDGLVFGSYLHGLFDDGTITRALLDYLNQKKGGRKVEGIGEERASIEKTWEGSLDLFCTTLCSSVDIERILEFAQIRTRRIRGSWKSSG